MAYFLTLPTYTFPGEVRCIIEASIDLVASVSPDSRDKDKQAKVDDATEPVAEGDSSARVDRWFDRQLTQLYGEVAEEPIPREILELVGKLKNPH